MADSITIQGLAQVGALLKELPQIVREKIAAKGVYNGADVTRREVEARAPFRTGLLRSKIRVARRRKGVAEDLITYVVYVQGIRPSSGKKAKRKRGAAGTANAALLPYYWYFLEFGTSKMSAKPFMVQAFTSSVQEAGDEVRDYSREHAEAEIAKRARALGALK